MTHQGTTLVEVLVAVALLALQAPAFIATTMAASLLVQQADVIVAEAANGPLIDRCVVP